MRYNENKKPDFVVMGAARSGTTWLYHRLKRHTGIFVPPIKEIHYFDIHRIYPVMHWIRIRRMILHFCRYLGYLRNRDGTNRERIAWLVKWGFCYFFRPKNHSWYSNLFCDELQRVSGELTPGYALLPRGDIESFYYINPEMKVVFQMRDPIDRAWSQTVMHLGLHERSGDYEQYKDEIRKTIFRDEVLRRSDYMTTINAWESVFPSRQIAYLFYDEIHENPVRLLMRLFDFLSVESSNITALDKSITRKVANRDTGGRQLPREIEKELAEYFMPMLDELESRFGGGYPAKWKERAILVLDGAK